MPTPFPTSPQGLSSSSDSEFQQASRTATPWTIELDDYITSLVWSPDGSALAAATASGVIAVVRAHDGSTQQYIQAHDAPITQLAWSPDGKQLASAAHDGVAKLWNPLNELPDHPQGNLIAVLPCTAHRHSWVEHLAWCAHGELLATAAGKHLSLWNATGEMICAAHDFARTISAIAWSPALQPLQSFTLAVASYGSVRLYDLAAFVALVQSTSHDELREETQDKLQAEFTHNIPSSLHPATTLQLPSAALTLQWSPDGAILAAGLQDNAVQFWRAPFSDETSSAMRGYPEKISQLAFDASSTLLATPSSRGVIVWSFLGGGPEGTAPLVIEGHFERVTQARFQHNGSLLATADETGLILISQPSSSDRPLRAETYQQEISQLAWSFDDRWLAIGTAEGLVDVWSPLS
jgi:WD40 repeat protein